MADDDEGVGLPQKGLNMIIKDVVPDLRIANESRELLNQCCVEFVRHVSREAQRISSCDQRKTIYHDHVQKALRNLAFPADYVQAANSVLDECKIAAEKRLKRKKSRLDKCGIPEEELYLMQQELIEKARREEAEKEMLLFHQQQQIYSQQLQSTSAVMFAAQSDAALMTQWMVAGGVPPDESADTFATAAGEQAVKVEVKGEPASSFLPSAGNQMAASSSAALGPVKSEPASENTTEPTPQTASSTAVPLMSNEMRAQLAADFVASLGAGDEENYD